MASPKHKSSSYCPLMLQAAWSEEAGTGLDVKEEIQSPFPPSTISMNLHNQLRTSSFFYPQPRNFTLFLTGQFENSLTYHMRQIVCIQHIVCKIISFLWNSKLTMQIDFFGEVKKESQMMVNVDQTWTRPQWGDLAGVPAGLPSWDVFTRGHRIKLISCTQL